MFYRNILLSLSTFFLLTGCGASSEPKQFIVDSANFSTAKNEDLCSVYGFRLNRAYEAKEELIKRNIFTQNEWNLIDNRHVIQGMSKCGVLAAYPTRVVKYQYSKDTQGNVIGESWTLSCQDAPLAYCPFTKIEFRNNKVIAIVATDNKN